MLSICLTTQDILADPKYKVRLIIRQWATTYYMLLLFALAMIATLMAWKKKKAFLKAYKANLARKAMRERVK